jgi:hypothetical protein
LFVARWLALVGRAARRVCEKITQNVAESVSCQNKYINFTAKETQK